MYVCALVFVRAHACVVCVRARAYVYVSVRACVRACVSDCVFVFLIVWSRDLNNEAAWAPV